MNFTRCIVQLLRRIVPTHNVKFEASGSKSLDCGHIVRVAGDQGYFVFKKRRRLTNIPENPQVRRRCQPRRRTQPLRSNCPSLKLIPLS